MINNKRQVINKVKNMNNTKNKLNKVAVLISIAALSGCVGGNSAASNQSPTNNTSNSSAATNTSLDAGKLPQLAAPELNTQAASPNTDGTECLSVDKFTPVIGNWWVTGQFSIKNNCDTPQNSSGLQLSLSADQSLDAANLQLNSISGLYFAAPVYWAPTTASIINSGNNKLTMTLVTSGVINPNSSVAGSFGYNPAGTPLTNLALSINGATPVSPANLVATINSSSLSSVCSATAPCNIPVDLLGQSGTFNHIIATVTNNDLGKDTITIKNLQPGSYTIAPSNLPNNTTVVITPAASFSLASGDSKDVTVKFLVKQDTTGSLAYTITNPNGSLFAVKSLPVTITSSSSSAVTQDSQFNQKTTVNSLTAGSYSMAIPGLASASQKAYYIYAVPTSINVTSGQTNDLGQITTTRETNLVTDDFKIDHLDNGDNITLKFTDAMNGSYHIFNPESITGNGATLSLPFAFPQGDTISVNVIESGSKYQPIAPFTFTQGSPAQSFTINLTQTPAVIGVYSPYKDVGTNGIWWPNFLIATKVNSDDNGAAEGITKALPQNVRTVTWAFATGNCGTETWVKLPWSQFAAPNIDAFENANMKYIVSTGGQAGAFTCDSNANMDAFVQHYLSPNLIGLDFDIEGNQISTAQIDSLVSTVAYAKTKYPSLRISFTLQTLADSSGEGASLNAEGTEVIGAAKADGLTDFYVNLMTMDYTGKGQASPYVCVVRNGVCEMGLSAIQAAKNFSAHYAIPLSRVELTPLIGNNDTPDEIFTLDDATTVANYVKQNGLAGLHYWSLDRDTPAGKGQTCSSGTSVDCNTVSTSPFQFSNIFAGVFK